MKRTGIFVYSLLISVCILADFRKPPETREVKFTLDVRPDVRISFDGSDIDLKIESWDQPKVEVLAVIEFHGRENDRVRSFLESFGDIVRSKTGSSPTEVRFDADFDEPNKVQIGSKNVGIIVGYNEDDLRISYSLKVPSSASLDLKNSYDDIRISGSFPKAEIEHYSGRLKTESIDDLELDLKYGDAELGNIGILRGVFYENDVEVEDLDNGDIEAKYSNLEFGSIGEVRFEIYESKVKARSISRMEGEFKYGSVEVDGNAGTVEVGSIYETEMEFGSVGRLQVRESKYCDFIAGSIQTFELNKSYEDEIEIGTLGSLNTSSKYSNYDVDLLERSFQLTDGYEGEIEIYGFSPKATKFQVDCKYCNIDLGVGSTPFTMGANLQYGDVNFDDAYVQRNVYIRDNDRLEIQVSSKNFQSEGLKIDIRGYEIQVDLD